MLVLDASVAVAWVLRERHAGVDAMVARLESGPAVVPELWHLEARNALLVAARRGRLERDAIRSRIRILDESPTTTDRGADLNRALALAERHDLTFYDAMYLELAIRQAAGLATLDGALARAARAEGVAVVSG